MSALFLETCYRHLTADSKEQFVFITGPELEGVGLLTHVIPFAHQYRTAGGVVGDVRSTHHALMDLEARGHRLLGHFHSHPGRGFEGTQPSAIDLRYQQRLEVAGYPTVGAIFSRDGFVRFFRVTDTVSVQVHGTGVRQVDPYGYQLTTVTPAG